MRHSALADLCPAAMHAGVFEYHCGSFRSVADSSHVLAHAHLDCRIYRVEYYPGHLRNKPV